MPSSPLAEADASAHDAADAAAEAAPRISKFRFKDRPQPKRRRGTSRSRSRTPSPGRDRHHRHHHRRHRRSHRRQRDPSPARSPPVSPNTAFRESLFDALADEEGAAYWEGVYGQPIHTYARPGTMDGMRAAGMEGAAATHDAEGNPLLERMNDEDYASYVRKRMWEKSHQHVIEERERREQAREKARAERARDEQRARGARQTWADRERRGRETKDRAHESKSERKRWRERWREYTEDWKALDDAAQDRRKENVYPPENEPDDNDDDDDDTYTPQQPRSRSTTRSRKGLLKLPFPTLTASGSKIAPEEIEQFYRSSIEARAITSTDQSHTVTLLGLLKAERVRWHPDKIAQRYGSLEILNEEVRQQVTALFQVIDTIYAKVLAETP